MDTQKLRWSGIIGMEGIATGDGRLIEQEALSWETPAPLRFVSKDVGAHDGAEVSGIIENIWRDESDSKIIRASGVFDTGGEAGVEAARVVGEGLMTGISMDLDNVSFEVRVAGDVLKPLEESDEAELTVADEDGRVKVLEIAADDELMVTTSARVRGATLVSIPAFIEARIDLDAETEDEGDEGAEVEETPEASADELVAASAPVAPPLAWFENPQLGEPTAMRVTDEGRVYGHLATWGVCHTASPEGLGTCTQAPASSTDYGYFHTGALRTAEGDEIAVGRITMDTGHAKGSAKALAALAHYDNTGTAAVDVRVGEDAYGIWFAGALRSTVTDEQLRSLRASPLSGDWRRLGGTLELVAVLAVNSPGFPVPRPAGLVASGEVEMLVAAGMLAPESIASEEAAEPEAAEVAEESPVQPSALSADDLRYLRSLAKREREHEASQLAQRVKRASAEHKVQSFVSRRKR